ncbi:transposase [Calothrix sp. NIES-4071]|nr:transposase [Calothrix sp. NIES-4071]BAZ60722.1 transposase [Calothrix sp. NIES-4105]
MDFQILEFNGEADHVHALIEYPPKLSVSQIVNSLKGVSSRMYGKAGFKKPYGKDAAMEVLAILLLLWVERRLKFLKNIYTHLEKPSF